MTAMTNEKTTMTKTTALSYVLDNCTLPEDVKAVITKMREQVQKHNATKGEYKSKTDVEAKALALLAEMADGKVYSTADLLTFETVQVHPVTGIPYTLNQLSALLKYLGAVEHCYLEKSKSKGKTMYKKLAVPLTYSPDTGEMIPMDTDEGEDDPVQMTDWEENTMN